MPIKKHKRPHQVYLVSVYRTFVLYLESIIVLIDGQAIKPIKSRGLFIGFDK